MRLSGYSDTQQSFIYYRVHFGSAIDKSTDHCYINRVGWCCVLLCFLHYRHYRKGILWVLTLSFQLSCRVVLLRHAVRNKRKMWDCCEGGFWKLFSIISSCRQAAVKHMSGEMSHSSGYSEVKFECLSQTQVTPWISCWSLLRLSLFSLSVSEFSDQDGRNGCWNTHGKRIYTI